MDKNGVCRNDGIGSVQRDTTEVRRPPPRSPAGATHHSVSQKYSSVGTRGIVYTGEVKHFKGIYQSITSLVQSNTSLPVEVWVNHYAFAPCSRIFYSFAFVQCRCFGDRELSSANSREDLSSGHAYACHSSVLVLGFESKFHALLSTHFQHVLYLDSDNIVTRNAEEVFNTVAYVDTGAVLWPDLWGVACSDTSRILSGHTASSQYVLWRAGFPGLDEHTHTIPEYYKRRRSNQCAADMHGDGCTRSSDNFGSSEDEGGKVCFNTSHADSTIAEHNCSYKYFHCRSSTQSSQWKHYLREHGQEAESGQLVLNLQLHKPLLSLGLHLIQDSAFFGRVFYGDKDIFRFIFLITGVPFHFMGIPGISVDASGRQDSLLHFHSSAGDAESDLADPPLSIQQQQPQKEQQHKATKTVLHVSAIDNCCARDIFQETAFGHHRSEDNKSIGENAALSALYRTQEILPLFVHQLRLRDPDALLRFIRVPPQHQGNASYCLVPRKRQYIHRSASAHSCVVNRTCSEWGSHDDCTDSSSTHSCHNRLGGSGVLVQPREARLLRDFARRLFDTVDAHWRQIEALNGTVAQ